MKSHSDRTSTLAGIVIQTMNVYPLTAQTMFAKDKQAGSHVLIMGSVELVLLVFRTSLSHLPPLATPTR